MIVELSASHIEEIMALEMAAFPPEMQASEATYRKRFALGHIALGYRRADLQGVISFSYGIFDPENPSTIPDNFHDWSTQKVPTDFNTVFIYNLGLLPSVRGTEALQSMIAGSLRRAAADGCRQVLAEGPIPSYAGNRHIQRNEDIGRSLESFVSGGPMPPEALLFKDPHLALYRRCSTCSIIRVMPNFLPTDSASGGFRAMLFRQL